MKILVEILYNLGILASISIISGFLSHKKINGHYQALSQGVLFGIAAIIGMLHPLVLAPGLIFDGRSIMISISGLFFGPLAAAVSAGMALALRLQQGGPGALMGTLVILSSALIGVLYHRSKKGIVEVVPAKELLGMGLVVHALMVLLMFTLPPESALATFRLLGPSVITVYPLATVLIGSILSEAHERRRIAEALAGSQIELQAQYEKVAASEYSFRRIFEGSSDAILIFKGYEIVDCNHAAAVLLGTGEKAQLLGKMVWDFSPELQADGQSSESKAVELIETCLRDSKIRFEWMHRTTEGKLVIVESVLTVITLHGEEVIHALIRDMSEHVDLKEKLEYLSYHDQLTGVYNRRFFEEELRRLNVRRNLPLTVMMADVNGLKLVNDSFGHAVGDRLLKKVTELIQKGCREDDIVSRIGGDEFMVLFPQTSSEEVKRIEARIQELTHTEHVESLDISVSFGWACKLSEDEDIDEILKKAEDYLYKKKLFESPSMRGKTINTIIRTLHEKSKREEAHAYRVSCLCESMGRKLGLSESEIKELTHVGLLHDIGKIAVDERMLSKPDALTQDEWSDMTRHPEIGYRILSTVNDMAEMAEYVLAHHERWDGRGYPKGLKGYEIPLQARIICLADAYDAMTSDRPYRQAISHEAAVKELTTHAGLQFDPMLVDEFIKMLTLESNGLRNSLTIC